VTEPPTDTDIPGIEDIEPAEPVDEATGTPEIPGTPEPEPVPRAAAPAGKRPTATATPGSLLLAAGVTAGWAAVVSFVPVLVLVLLAWLAAGRGTGSAVLAMRVAAAGWLLGNGVPVGTAGGPVGLVPLVLTALAAWRLIRAGEYTARAVGHQRRVALPGALAVAVGYGLLAALVALLVSGPGLEIGPVRAGLTAGGLALLCAVIGAVRETGMARHIWRQLSPAVRYGLRGGVFATFGLLAAGALAAGAAVAVNAPEAADVMRSYHGGVLGALGLTLLCAVYAPTVAVWAVSYLVGPGFAVGTGTGVGIASVQLGPLPAVPVLAGLPAASGPSVLGSLLLAVPAAIGALTGILIARRQLGAGLRPVLAATGLTGVVAGVLTAVAGMLAGGPLGDGRLSEIGPSWWLLGLAVAALIGVPAAVAAAAARGLAVTPPQH
jgi:hypothetical protein